MKKKTIISLFSIIALFVLSITITIAWLSTSLSNTITAEASVHKAYFQGEGTEESPYLIEYEAQFYYFAWLQDLGYFNDDEPNGVAGAAPVYFRLENNLDMYQYVLPPAGTIEKPFIGYFDGNGKTISNLSISTSSTTSDLTDVPNNPRNNNTIAESDYQVVGVFGVIGDIDTNYTSSSFTPTVTNLNIDSATVYSKDPKDGKTLIGVFAGLVNGIVEKTTVANSTVKVNSSGLSTLSYTENLSDYALIGYCAEPYRKSLDVKKVTFTEPTETENILYKNTQAEGAAFGGSMKMDEVFTRIQNAYSATNSRPTGQYSTADEVIFEEIADDEFEEISRTSTRTGTPSGDYKRYYYSSAHPEYGTYYYYPTTNQNNWYYIYQETKTCVYIYHLNDYEDGFTIYNGTYYLNLNDSNALTNNTVTDGPTGWVMDNDGYIYTYTSKGYQYYLYGTNTISASTTNKTRFTKGNDGTLSYTYNNMTYYIIYNNGWTVIPAKQSYYIHNGNNYLYRSSATAAGNINSTTNAYREWSYDEANHKLFVYYSNTPYYLYVDNGSLAVTTARNTANTVWQVDTTNNKVYYDNNGTTWYLTYNNQTWSVFPAESAYRIYNGSNYLTYNNTTTVTSQTAANSSYWGYDTTTSKLFTTNGNTIYYLYVNNNGDLRLSNSESTASTVWSLNGDNTISCERNGVIWYLRCDNGTWSVFPAKTTYYITEGSNYLNNNGSSSVTSSTTASTEWIIDQTNGSIQTVYNGTIYYLVINNSYQLSFSQTNDTPWTFNSDNTLQATKNGITLFIQNVNNTWRLYPSKTSYFLYVGDDYLGSSNNSTVSVVTAEDALELVVDETNGKIYSYSNGTKYYLVVGANNAISLSQADNTTWAFGNGRISTTVSQETWYLRCYDGRWELYPATSSIIISSSQGYMGRYENMFIDVEQEAAIKWIIDSGNHIYTMINEVKYYLSGTDTLSLTTNIATVWTHNQDGTLSYTYNSKTYYLFDLDEVYTVKPSRVLYFISQNGFYLNANSASTVNGVMNMADSSSWVWNESAGTLSTNYNGTDLYLNANGQNVLLSTTSTTEWERDTDNGFMYDNNGSPYYLVYDNGWVCYPSKLLYTITDGTNYLSHEGTTLVNHDETNPTLWFNNGSGKYYFIHNGTPYYLRVTTTGLSVVANAAQGSVLSYDGTNTILYITDSVRYYVVYDSDEGDWIVVPHERSAFYISSSGSYLNTNGSGIQRGTQQNSATKWIYNGTSGTMSTIVNGVEYYLVGYIENTQLSITTTNLKVSTDPNEATTWIKDGNNLYCNLTEAGISKKFYLLLDTNDNNLWKIHNTAVTYFTIASGTTYFGLSTSVAATNTRTLWYFSNTTAPSGNGGQSTAVSTVVNNTRYYVTLNGGLNFNTSSTNIYYYRRNNSYYLQSANSNNSYYGLRYSGNAWSSASGRRSALTRTQVNFTASTLTFSDTTIESGAQLMYNSYVDEINIASNTILEEINVNSFTYNNVDEDLTISRTSNSYGVLTFTARNNLTSLSKVSYNFLSYTITEVRNAMLSFTDKSVQKTSREEGITESAPEYGSAIPINADSTNPFAVSESNTGYIIGGGYSAASGSGRGDVRISRYSKTNTTNNVSGPIGNAINGTTYSDSKLEIITAVNHGDYNGFYRISDTYNGNNNSVANALSSAIGNNRKVSYNNLGLTRYAEARSKLTDMLNGSYIYGLHFMATAIDKNHSITLSQAMIDGVLRENFEMPNASIDFSVNMRGYITVFAGTYYGDNSSLFSLHQIFRNSDNSIREIKEISKIYSTSGNEYVYQYTDGNYSSSTDRVALLFDMTWMTNPSVLVYNAVYYFEIPVNKGEYALGSVSGKDGAYLFYLDIGANGGQAEDRFRTTVTEQFRIEEYSSTVPLGIQLVESGESYNEDNPYELITLQLDSTFKDEYLLTRTGNVVTNQDKAGTQILYVNGALSMSSGGGNYYPNGYIIKTIENITDINLNSSNEVTATDKMRLETLNTYDSSGTFVSRVVTLYAGLDVTTNEEEMIKIISFSYTPNANDSTYIRVARAASSGGFNIAFNEVTTINLTTSSIESSEVHVNFGPNNGATLISYEKSSITGDISREIPLVDLSGGHDSATEKNIYYRSVIGEELGTVYITYEFDSDDEERTIDISTTITYNPELGIDNTLPSGNLSQTLTYEFTITPSSGDIEVSGSIEATSDTDGYDTYLVNYDVNPIALVSKKVTYSAITVEVNDEALTNGGS